LISLIGRLHRQQRLRRILQLPLLRPRPRKSQKTPQSLRHRRSLCRRTWTQRIDRFSFITTSKYTFPNLATLRCSTRSSLLYASICRKFGDDMNTDGAYSFVFRGLLTEEALDKTGRLRKVGLSAHFDPEIAARLPIDSFDEDLVARAQKMAVVYVAIAAFENSVREFVSKVLLEKFGENWWTESVSEKIRERAESRREEETKIRWHTPRGDEPINYTEFGDLGSI